MDKNKRKFHLFLRPKYKTPDLQLHYADRLSEKDHLRRAGRHYRALVAAWPDSQEAPQAMFRYAGVLEKRGKYLDAFDEYEKLVEDYDFGYDFDTVLDKVFRIGHFLLNNKKRFLLFGAVASPERAIPVFEFIVTKGPRSEHAAESAYYAGYANEKILEYEKAIESYGRVLHLYPTSEWAEQAAYSQAYCYYLLANESPNGTAAMDDAWVAWTVYLNRFPRSKNAESANEYREEMYERRAKAAFDKARYYDKIARKPKAAVQAYQSFLKEFPHSLWTKDVQRRIEALTLTADMERKDDE
ncbi:MAG: tetratricopeptide repeat protein [Verrucomicrobia bacterium]|nr:tetratricopeptide repeat protein [Verrucomicrobiota bacterium]